MRASIEDVIKISFYPVFGFSVLAFVAFIGRGA
jgi:hypothetical protein